MYETQLARSWTGTASQKSLKSRSANIAATKLRRLFCTDRFRSARSYFKTRRAFGVSEGPQVNDFQGPQGKKPIIIRQKCGEETIMLQHNCFLTALLADDYWFLSLRTLKIVYLWPFAYSKGPPCFEVRSS